MSIKLLNEKRMDELIQFIHQEEITKEYLKQNPLPLGKGLLLLMRKIKNTFQNTIKC